ncbi:MAG TPA: LacI family DNA-binding transcriptional regulator [Chloroflexota bacterium]|nr:LacI family DNA-binding transcriptional regulator [Chloroflexota bacterium]
MATLKDIARAANLSVTTASRALNDHGDVAAETRAHVRRVAAQLGYHPNHTGRSLQGTRTNTIGLVIPQLIHRYVDSFWLEFIGGVSSICAEQHFDLLITTGSDLPAEHAHYQRLVRSKRVDGVILCDVRVRDPRVSFLRGSRAPFVAFGRTLGADDYSWIDVDGAAGVREAIDHLLALGHRRIAFLGTHRDFSFSHFRYEGYLEALLAAGLPIDDDLVIQDLEVGSDIDVVLRRLLALPAPPTAVFACTDFLASGVLHALRQRKLIVPDNLSLVVFDDTLVTQHADPPLTSIRQNNHAIGCSIAALLIRQIRDAGPTPLHELVLPQLILRRSTAAPAVR